MFPADEHEVTPRTIRKTLSANDSGQTGGHQAGILIPRDLRILSFFPQLNASEYNPRSHILFEDAAGTLWEFAFIYYNNRKFGGTRDEYRLTRMTRYIRQVALTSGDEIVLHRDEHGQYSISHCFANPAMPTRNESVLSLAGGWRILDIS